MKKDTLYIFVFALISFAIVSCKGNANDSALQEENLKGKEDIQGVWINEEDGNAFFMFKGDSVYFPEGKNEPASFHVTTDSLHINTHHASTYALHKLTANLMKFENANGEEITLVKTTDEEYTMLFNTSSDASLAGTSKDSLKINMDQRIKRDTIVMVGETRMRTYIQVNPGHARVYKQIMNEYGMETEQVYNDNSIYINIYNGGKCIYRHNYYKEHFKKIIPADFLEQAILSDIVVVGSTDESVQLNAIIAKPDTYESYNVSIFISPNGKMRMELYVE